MKRRCTWEPFCFPFLAVIWVNPWLWAN